MRLCDKWPYLLEIESSLNSPSSFFTFVVAPMPCEDAMHPDGMGHKTEFGPILISKSLDFLTFSYFGKRWISHIWYWWMQ